MMQERRWNSDCIQVERLLRNRGIEIDEAVADRWRDFVSVLWSFGASLSCEQTEKLYWVMASPTEEERKILATSGDDRVNGLLKCVGGNFVRDLDIHEFHKLWGEGDY